MPEREFIAKEMSTLLGVLAHPHRIRIVEELRAGEKDVNTMQSVLGISHSRVSQHLSVLRSHRVVVERREGRHVFYRLSHPRLARWLLDGLEFLSLDTHIREVSIAVERSREIWGDQIETPEQRILANHEARVRSLDNRKPSSLNTQDAKDPPPGPNASRPVNGHADE
jgi:DNA-binding transcriptional ArsR family regulator